MSESAVLVVEDDAALREALVAARNYMDKWARYEEDLAEYESKRAAGGKAAEKATFRALLVGLIDGTKLEIHQEKEEV